MTTVGSGVGAVASSLGVVVGVVSGWFVAVTMIGCGVTGTRFVGVMEFVIVTKLVDVMERSIALVGVANGKPTSVGGTESGVGIDALSKFGVGVLVGIGVQVA